MTMFQYLEYPASRGKIHISGTNPYQEPSFDSGFMNNKADFAPIRWSYKKTREVARRMDGTFKIPHFSPATTDVEKIKHFAGNSPLIILISIRHHLRLRRTSTSKLRSNSCQTH